MNTKLEKPKMALNLNSGAVHIEHKSSLKERQVWLYLAWKAIPILKTLNANELEEKVIKLQVSLSEIKKAINYNGHNNERLKEIFNSLLSTTVKWNIFEKDNNRWGGCNLLSYYEVESKKDTAICTFAFNPFIQARLAYPDMYTRINLLISREFTSKSSLAIYSLALDYLNIKNNYGEKVLTLEDLRKYLGLKDTDYKNSGDLYKWVIKVAEKDINDKSDMNIKIEVRKEDSNRLNSKIMSFKLKMSIKKEFMDFYKPQKTINSITDSKQPNLFDLESDLLKAPQNEEEKKPKIEKSKLIKVENPELKKFYAGHKISITTNTVQNRLKEIQETLQDKFENYLVFLMNYTVQEAKKNNINNLAGFYIGLLKDDSQLDNYLVFFQQQEQKEHIQQVKIKSMLDGELQIQYEKFLSDDFENYLMENIDNLEAQVIKLIKSTIKPGEFISDVLIGKNHKGIIDKTLITDSKPSTKAGILAHLRNYKIELDYKSISFDSWKVQEVTEQILKELEEKIIKSI